MMLGLCEKCLNCNLNYEQFLAHLFAMADFPVLSRIGSLMSCIPPVRNVRDVAHCCARVGTSIGKRLKDNARTWGTPGDLEAVSHCNSNLRQEVKHILVAERVMCPASKKKEQTLDINASRLFCETHDLHAESLHIPLATTRRTHITKFSRVFAFIIVLCFRGVFEGARRNGTIRLVQFKYF